MASGSAISINSLSTLKYLRVLQSNLNKLSPDAGSTGIN